MEVDKAISSDPKVDDLTVFYVFECHIIGAMFTFTINSVRDRLVT